jgi:3D (Asp-Asp-Asp) domain-containing protein
VRRLLLVLLFAVPVGAKPAGRKVRLVTTAYCLGPCRRCGTSGITKLGSRSMRGVAVGSKRRAIALGSTVTIPGYGRGRVDDVGGGVRGNQLDLRFRSHSRAEKWGRKVIEVTIQNRPKKK